MQRAFSLFCFKLDLLLGSITSGQTISIHFPKSHYPFVWPSETPAWRASGSLTNQTLSCSSSKTSLTFLGTVLAAKGLMICQLISQRFAFSTAAEQSWHSSKHSPSSLTERAAWTTSVPWAAWLSQCPSVNIKRLSERLSNIIRLWHHLPESCRVTETN